jgi:predicted helicase
VPGSFRLIRELVQFLDDLSTPEYAGIRWLVEDEILSMMNGLKLREIHEDLSFKHRKAISPKVRAADEEEHRLFERDPFIYFYEDYLKAYDPAMRKGRGVYYTPPPIVNFIVRAVDDILKESFGIPDGLADHKRVTVLDFACGTGTFILEALERIFENIGGAESAKASLVVREHMLRNIYGFEYLIAPYTIAHLKLSQYLKDKDHPLNGNQRLQVFLTNTLEPIVTESDQRELWPVPALASEIKEAQTVKAKPILVIVGNPPYAYESRNNGVFITAAIDEYRYIWERPTDVLTGGSDGTLERRTLGERNPRGLQDDYVKFIRFAQMKMDAVPEGVVGVITNHSWLDNATFRGMRQSLMRSFEQIYVLDLHGNAKKKERAPDGSKDENVFDIEQGVAISLLVKRPGLGRGVWRGDFWGKQLEKYKLTVASNLKTCGMEPLRVTGPDYMFIDQNLARKEIYDIGWSLPDIFVINSVGLVTARDEFTLCCTADDIWKRVQSLVSDEVENVRAAYGLGRDTRDWTVAGAITDLTVERLTKDRVKPVHYRPFDTRQTYVTGRSRGFLSYPRMAIWNRLGANNLALVSSRFTKGELFAHALVTDTMIEKIIMSPNTSNNGFIFPLYDSPEGSNENLSGDFRTFIESRYEHHPYSAEEILGYIYAVLHAPSYRTRYAEFLRIDFPRVPFPESADDFEPCWASAGRSYRLTCCASCRDKD